MRRSWAILLLAVFSFSLIGPALLASVSAQLPSCCTRSGKHHCSSMSSMNSADTSGQAVQAVRQQCPYYPSGGAVPMHAFAAVQQNSQMFFAAIQSHPAAHAQTEARYRVSFSRSGQKRGPPVLPC